MLELMSDDEILSKPKAPPVATGPGPIYNLNELGKGPLSCGKHAHRSLGSTVSFTGKHPGPLSSSLSK
jgi:hypothetical protein